MPRTICYLENGTSGGGSFESMTLLATRLDRSRYTPVVVVVNATPHADVLRAAGIAVHELADSVYSIAAAPWGRRVRVGVRTAVGRFAPGVVAGTDAWVHRQTVASLVDIVSREQVALLHCNNQSVRDWYGIVAAQRVGIPAVSHLRSVRMGVVPPLFASAITRSVSSFIANSQHAADVWIAALRIPSTRMTIIPNAIGHAPVPAIDLRHAFGIPPDAPLIGCVGNFTHGKGQEHLVDAMVLIRSQRPDAHCVFVGDGLLRAAVEQRAVACGCQRAVRFVGYRTDARGIIAGCDVLVVPSDTETFGRTILEGYVARTPVVATRVGGIPEVIRDGVTGILVPAADPDAIADAVLRFLGDPALVARCVAAGYDTCVQQYGVAPHVAAVTEVYDRVLGR